MNFFQILNVLLLICSLNVLGVWIFDIIVYVRQHPSKSMWPRLLKYIALETIFLILAILCMYIGRESFIFIFMLIYCSAGFLAMRRKIGLYLKFSCGYTGIDEDIFLTLGGQEQRVLIQGKDVSNPVIIYLFGGPAAPRAYESALFTAPLKEYYTIVLWDQRGCGSTYIKNRKVDPDNRTVSQERILKDLDELVEYIRTRFSIDKVIIMADSYGTMLGTNYVAVYPQKVSAYIGCSSFVALEECDVNGYTKMLDSEKLSFEEKRNMVVAFENYIGAKDYARILALSNYVLLYLPKKTTRTALLSTISTPDFTKRDYRWIRKVRKSFESYYMLNKSLFDYAAGANILDFGTSFDVPMYYISWEGTWFEPTEKAAEYVEAIRAPKKEWILLGENEKITSEAFAIKIRQLLEPEESIT